MANPSALFTTPTLEVFLQTSTAGRVEARLAECNAAGEVREDAVDALIAALTEAFRVTDGPALAEEGMTFENAANRLVTVFVPVSGDLGLLTFQVRNLPPPNFNGTLRMDPEHGRLCIEYKGPEASKTWDAGLDGDVAMLRTYVASTAAAIATLNQALPGLIEAKIRAVLEYNRVRADVATRMLKRGFTEVPTGHART